MAGDFEHVQELGEERRGSFGDGYRTGLPRPKWLLLLAGPVTLTRYGPGLATIGMMVVASRYGRQGLGGRLMRHVLELASGAVIYLTATDYGRRLYERLGFLAIDRSTPFAGIFTAGPADRAISVPRPATPDDTPVIAAMDLAVFGADRRQVLTELPSYAEHLVVCGDPVSGYAAAWLNGSTLIVGPVVADDPAVAIALIGGLAGSWPGQVRVDILGRHAELASWAQSHGLAAREQTALMIYGGSLLGDRGRLFGPVSVAIG